MTPRLPAILTLACASLPAPCQEGGRWQLLDNRGGESPAAVRTGEDRGRATFDTPGWAAVEGEWVAQEGPWYDIRPVEGDVFFRPLPGPAAAMRQVVELAPSGARRPTHVIAGASVRTWKGEDVAELVLDLIDASGVVVASAAARGLDDAQWTWHEVRLDVPSIATHAALTLRGIRKQGKIADACFDDVVLETLGSGHPPSLTGVDRAELVAGLANASDRAQRRALLRALAGQGARGEAELVDRVDNGRDEDEKRYALTLLAASRSRRAPELLERAASSGDAAARAHAMTLIAALDRGGVALLSRIAREGEDAARKAALRALAARADRDAVRELQKIARAGGEAATLDVLEGVRAASPDPETVYRPLVAPHLTGDAAVKLRNAAMDTLAALSDPRFLTHLVELAPDAGSLWLLSRWTREAASFDSAAALAALVTLLDERVRFADQALLEALPRMSVREATEWSARVGIAHESPLVRLAAVRQLANAGPSAEVADALRRACADTDPVVAREAVVALANRADGDVAANLERLVDRGEAAVSAAALAALADVDRARAVAIARDAATGHRHWQARVASLSVLAEEAKANREIFVEAFDDDTWQVRVAAYRSIARLRSRETIELLIPRMSEERGSARAYLADALADLTGSHRGDEAAAWERWWAIVASDFVVPPKSKDRVASDAAARTTTYHGIPVRSDRLVFAIDLSGSMRTEVEGKTKLRVAQDELIAVLRTLRPPQRFGLVGFGTDVHPFEDALLEATPENVDRGVQWVEALTIRGSTNVFGALEASLAFPDAEAVFLLTDGEPSAGTYVDTREIRRVVRSLNAERMVRIHTIAVGGGRSARAFLEALAEENSGVYRGD